MPVLFRVFRSPGQNYKISLPRIKMNAQNYKVSVIDDCPSRLAHVGSDYHGYYQGAIISLAYNVFNLKLLHFALNCKEPMSSSWVIHEM